MAKTTPVATDDGQDGKIELDPARAEMTMVDLVILDHKLRDEGSSLASLLSHMARSSLGIVVN